MTDRDAQNEVYKQSCEDHRFYGDMRFKQLTLWSAGIAFILNVLYGKDASSLTTSGKGVWYTAAFFWTSVIWVMEVRSTVHGVRCRRIKDIVEKAPDRESSNKWTLLNATNTVGCLYAISSLIWAIQLQRSWGYCVATVWVVAVSFVVLLMFTLREYWHLLKNAIKRWTF